MKIPMIYDKHQYAERGDLSFIDKLLPNNIKVHHMDSTPERFQGAFYYAVPGFGEVVCNEAPLELLRIAKKYKVSICNCEINSHTTWTIWF